MNGFEEEGAKALETMLTDNHTLLELDISFCRVPVTGSPFIAAGLQKNDTLEKITVMPITKYLKNILDRFCCGNNVHLKFIRSYPKS